MSEDEDPTYSGSLDEYLDDCFGETRDDGGFDDD
jgi:hypothetical protein